MLLLHKLVRKRLLPLDLLHLRKGQALGHGMHRLLRDGLGELSAICSLRCSLRSCACWTTSAICKPGRRAGDDAWTSVPKALVRFAGAEDGRCRCCAATNDAARLNLYFGEQSVQTGGFGFWPSKALSGSPTAAST